MKNPLIKRLPREFKNNLGKYLAILLLMTTTITVGSGFLIVADSTQYTLDKDQKDGKLEDGAFATSFAVPDETLKQLENLGLTVEEKYYIDYPGFDKDATLRIYENRDNLNKTAVHKGKLPEKENEIALDRIFAMQRDLVVGNTVNVDGKEMKITGLISLPDYCALFRRNSDLIMDTIYFGVAVVSHETFEKLDTNKVGYSYGYYYDERNLSEKEKKELESSMLKTLYTTSDILEFLPQKDNQAITFVEEDMGTDVPMMKAVIFILIAIIAFVFAILIRSTIEEESAIIGTLRANGYTKHELLRHYVALPIIVTIISAIIGNALGYTIIIEPFKALYYKTFSLPPFEPRWNMEAFLLTTIIPLIIMLVINYVVIFRMLSISPLKFLRRDLKRRKQKKAVKLPDWSFVNRFRMRVILQNKGSYLILFVGIFFASVLLLFGLGLMPLINNYAGKADESMVADYEYILKTPVTSTEGEALTVTNMNTWYDFGGFDMNVVFNGIAENSTYYDKLPLYDVEEGIVISSDFANKVGYKKGDTITFKDPYKETSYEFKVAEVYDYKGSFSAFMKQKDLNKILEKEDGYFNAYLTDKPMNLEERCIAKIIAREDMKGAVEQITSSFKEIAQGINAASILIYLVLIYLLTKVVIDKNANNISLMKVFGYQQNEVRKLYLHATSITVVASLLLCIPLEMVVIKTIMKYGMDNIEGYIEATLPWHLYLEVVLAGIVSYVIINSIHVHRIKKISMNLTLKNRE